MHEIKNDGFYELAKQYDSDPEYHFVGEVDYHLLEDDKPYEGLQPHRDALIVVFDRLVENSIEDLKGVRERYGNDKADQLSPLVYDIDKAQPTLLDPDDFFYCPNIVKLIIMATSIMMLSGNQMMRTVELRFLTGTL